MPKLMMLVLGVLWFASAVWAGHRMAGESFAWMFEPALGAKNASGETFSGELPDLDAVRKKLPADGEDPAAWFVGLPASTQECLKDAIGDHALQEALQEGEFRPTPSQIAGVANCLK